MPSFRNVRPCTFVGYEFASKLATVWNHGHPRPRMYIRVHLWATSLQANSLLYGTTDVLVAVEQCTSMYTVQRRVCGANSLLLNFTDIPVRSEKPFTISFFENRRHRYKARAKIKRRRTFCTLSIYFCAATP